VRFGPGDSAPNSEQSKKQNYQRAIPAKLMATKHNIAKP
jgi:hypothetical protein